MSRPLSLAFLSDDLTVKCKDDGRVAVTVVLPPDLVADYCQFLEALSGFFRVVDRKVIHQLTPIRINSPEEIEETNRRIDSYRSRLVVAFDGYISSGLDRESAVKRVAADLRAVSHPWCSVHVVRSELVACGRGGVPGRPRGSRRGQP